MPNIHKIYSRQFHTKRVGNPRYTALATASIAAFRCVYGKAPAGVVDIGCSVGMLLREMHRQCGCATYGIDFSVDPADVVFKGTYAAVDMETAVAAPPDIAVDLAVCQEVLEHVYNTDNALKTIDVLTAGAGMLIFGAARPGQGGVHHVTMKPKQEWAALLAARGWTASPEAMKAYADVLVKFKVGGCWLHNTMCLVPANKVGAVK